VGSIAATEALGSQAAEEGEERPNEGDGDMRRTWRAAIATLGVVALAAAVLATAGGAGARPKADTGSLSSYPRSQTLITSGTQWGNIAGTNPYVGNYAAGMVGLVNETLLRFDPLKDKYINWLAKSATWTAPQQFTIVVRPGVKWADGKKFTGGDVAFNLNLTRFKTSPWNNLYLNVKAPIVAHGSTVIVNFKSTPNYVQWQNAMWNIPLISPAQAKDAITNAASLTTYSPGNPIGTGPYTMDSKGYDPTTRVVYVKKTHWWAADHGISPSPKPKYIIDLVNTSNTNSLSAVLAGVEDLNNNYLPGVESLVNQGKVSTY
jgi:peptide/nickel transport system substrate-binding protein